MENLTHQYNGKEQQDKAFDGGVRFDWYDYGFRFYDPELARFHTLDPLAEKNHSQSGFVYANNNPVLYIDYLGLDATRYEDEEKNEIITTNDGSDDVVIVPAEKQEKFQEFIDVVKELGITEDLDDTHWNDNMKADFLGFESIEEMEGVLSNTSSKYSRQKLIEVIQSDNDSKLLEFVAVEVISQLANPLNHIPYPIKVKTKIPLKAPRITTPTSTNSWHIFRKQMGKGAYTKQKYGSSDAAKAARKAAYKEWKNNN